MTSDLDNVILTPQEISQTPLPSVTGMTTFSDSSGVTNDKNTSADVMTPPTQDVTDRFPPQFIAPHVISDSLNTLSKQILGIFTFGQVGALKIGTYEFGISGEIDISPNGITAKNVNGDTTFAIDGATGNATFLGTLQAGTVIAGDNTVIIGTGSGGGGRILLTNSGVPQIVIGDPT